MSNEEQVKDKHDRESPRGSELALAVAVWIFGMMVSYFPTYAGLPETWTWPFRGMSWIFYGIGAVIALFGLGNIMNSRFLLFIGTATGFGGVAFLCHF